MELRGRSVLIVGFERTGEALCRFLLDRGARVTVSDKKPAEAFGSKLGPFLDRGVVFETGGHRPETFLAADLIVPSPGVPPIAEILAARDRGVPVLAEIELAYLFLKGRIVAITGSNGKSTTTTLVHRILRDAGLRARLAGNIGTPLVSFVDRSRDDDVYVTEISSFQLEYTERFTPAVAALLNVSENHIDWHGTFDRYFAAKTKLILRMGPDGRAVLNRDDARVWGLRAEARARVYGFSRKRRLARGASLEDGWIVLRDGASEKVLPAARIALPGAHNLENVLAAAMVARLLGVPPASIRRSVLAFRGLEHRLEEVLTVRGVRFVNDSKATTVDATLKALASFDRPVVLILGGTRQGRGFLAPARRGPEAGPRGRARRRGGGQDREGPRRRPARRPGPGLPRGRPDRLRAGRPGRHRPPGSGLHELGHVQELRGARPDLQAGGPSPRRRPAAEGSPGMSARRRLSFDVPLLAVTVMLVVLGIFFVFSSSSFMAREKYDQSFHFMIQQVVGALAGLALIAFLTSVRKPFFLQPGFVYGLLGLTVLLLLLCLAMPSVAHTNRWIILFGVRFQPSELAKISLILFLATYAEAKKDTINEIKTLAVPVAVLIVAIVLVLLEPDFGTAVLAGRPGRDGPLHRRRQAPLPRRRRPAGPGPVRLLPRPGRLPGPADPGVPRRGQGRPGGRLPGRPVQARVRLGRAHRGGPRPVHAEAQLPAVRPHGFHLRHPGRGDRAPRDPLHPRPVPLLPLAGAEDLPDRAQSQLQDDRRRASRWPSSPKPS